MSSAFTPDSMHTRLLLATRDNLVNIDILTDNGRIFAAELKGHSFEHFTCLLHDFLPNKCGAGEANLSRDRMRSKPRSQSIISREALYDVSKKDVLRKFTEPEVTRRYEW